VRIIAEVDVLPTQAQGVADPHAGVSEQRGQQTRFGAYCRGEPLELGDGEPARLPLRLRLVLATAVRDGTDHGDLARRHGAGDLPSRGPFSGVRGLYRRKPGSKTPGWCLPAIPLGPASIRRDRPPSKIARY
jgi:hypothetical protein